MTTPTPPATRPRNPEAERLIEVIRERRHLQGREVTAIRNSLRAALRRERRNAVAEIRERAEMDYSTSVLDADCFSVIADTLDEVAGLSDD